MNALWRRLRCWLTGHQRPVIGWDVSVSIHELRKIETIYGECPRCQRMVYAAWSITEAEIRSHYMACNLDHTIQRYRFNAQRALERSNLINRLDRATRWVSGLGWPKRHSSG